MASVSVLGAAIGVFVGLMVGLVGGYFAGYYTPRTWDRPFEFRPGTLEARLSQIDRTTLIPPQHQALVLAVVGVLLGALLAGGVIVGMTFALTH